MHAFKYLLLVLVLGSAWWTAGCNDDPQPCEPGKLDCPCFPNRTCLNDLTCGVAGLCERRNGDAGVTPDGSTVPDDSGVPPVTCALDSDCDVSGQATAGYLCASGLCTPCADDSDCVSSLYYGSGTRCGGAGRCERIATCATDGCPQGGVCDEMSGLCRDPQTCEEIACAPLQVCQEATADDDAECLAQCEDGYAWNQVDANCQAIPPNCREGWANSLLTTCAAALRQCVETEDNASCGECYPGYRDDGSACVPVVTCSDLSCGAELRVCVMAGANTDAYCGDCQPGFTERFGTCQGRSSANCTPGDPDSIFEECAAAHRTCVPAATSAACGPCMTGTAENPATSQCETEVTCGELDCGDQHRICEVTWNAQCAACESLYQEDPATGECVCSAGTLPGATGGCEPIVTCADIGAACTSVGELCIEATSTNHASCRKCFEDEAWYEHWQSCLPCPPCTKAGETGRVYPITSQMGHCVCETQPGYYHSESGLGGTFACDKDGDGWVTAAARLALEAPVGTAELENARCDLRQIDRFVLINEAGERREVPLSGFDFLSGAVPLYEPENRDRPERLQNDYDYTNPNLANYAPALGGGRTLTAAELNPLTKLCPTASGDPNARFADFNANGVADLDELGPKDERADAEARIFSMFSFFMELHRGYYEHPAGELFGRWVIRERDRGTMALPGFNLPLCYPAGADYWRTCTRFRDSDYDLDGPPYNLDFAAYGATSDCAIDGGAGSWCGMNHHSQFKCLLVVDSADLDPELPHHLTSTSVHRDHEANQCQPGATQELPTAGTTNGMDPAVACQLEEIPAAGHAVWGAVKYQDYGDTKAPNSQYVRGCINECAEEDLLPLERQCQGPPGPPPILCNGQESDFGRLFCYREMSWVEVPLFDQTFLMGSPDGVTCHADYPGCPGTVPAAEPGRDPGEMLHSVEFSSYEYTDLVVTTTEITQDQFLDFMGYNPSRFDCGGSVCPVEQVTFFDALAMANVMSDRLGYDRCYDWQSMRCADGTYEDLWDEDAQPDVYLGNYCLDHTGIAEVYHMDTDFELRDRTVEHWQSGFSLSADCEGFRLPTEAEWEFLARADTLTATYAGENDASAQSCEVDPLLNSIGWYCGNSDFRTAPVGLKAPNAYGLYDMLGNVWEWVIDSDVPYSGDVIDPDRGNNFYWNGRRIVRGGAWNRDARDARAARRVAYSETTRNYAVGFRLVRSRYAYSRYILVLEPKSWTDAEDDCQARGGHLVSINRAQINFRLWRWLALVELQEETRLWIGYNDRDVEDTWIWSDGTLMEQNERFVTGEPDGGAAENCAYLHVDPSSSSYPYDSWYSYDCDSTNPGGTAAQVGYLCELPLSIP